MSGGKVVVHIGPVSDGNPQHRPPAAGEYTAGDPTSYLERLATNWMRDRGELTGYASYILDRLPDGYAVFQRVRVDGKTTDKYLYGHPSGSRFDSVKTFYPHFKHLMDHGMGPGCLCTLCSHPAGRTQAASSAAPAPASSTSTQTPAPAPAPALVFGTYPFPQAAAARLGNNNPLPAAMPASSHPQQFLARPAHRLPPPQLTDEIRACSPATEFAFGLPVWTAPRKGVPVAASWKTAPYEGDLRHEILSDTIRPLNERDVRTLWSLLHEKLMREGTLDQAIVQTASRDWGAEQEFLPKLLRKLHHDPQWLPRVGEIVIWWVEEPFRYKAGVVIESSPNLDRDAEGVRPEDCLVRVEVLEDVNKDNSGIERCSQYFPLDRFRPFFVWPQCEPAMGIPECRATFEAALRVASNVSPVGAYRFRGTWPNAKINFHGLYLGPELLVVGDTVRLVPSQNPILEQPCPDVLVVKAIYMNVEALDLPPYDRWYEKPFHAGKFMLEGYAYTFNRARHHQRGAGTEVPKASDGYGTDYWIYPAHDHDHPVKIPLVQVLGRLHEHHIAKDMFRDCNNWKDVINYGIDAVRGYLDDTQSDDREPRADDSFRVYESRTEALGLGPISNFVLSDWDLQHDAARVERYVNPPPLNIDHLIDPQLLNL